MTTDLTRTSRATPLGLWRVLTDFSAYGDWIPFTTMRTDVGAPRLGWGFAGLSGLGPLRFADSMILTRWEPPTDDPAATGTFRVVKTGRVLAGWAEVTVGPHALGSVVHWREQITPRPVPLGRAISPLSARVTDRMFAGALDTMVSRADERAGSASAATPPAADSAPGAP